MAEIIRHKKTGGLYEVLFRGAVIHSDVPLYDDAPVTVCRRLPDGQIVARYGATPRGSFDVLHHSRLQTGKLLYEGDEVVVYRALNGGPAWVRPTSEMNDGRFEPATALQAPETTPPGGEVEGLVDALIGAVTTYECTKLCGSSARAATLAGDVETARAALLAVIRPTPSGDGIQGAREAVVAELIAATTDLLDNALEYPIGDEYAIHPDEWDKRPGDSLGKQLYRSRWMLRDRVRKALRALSTPARQEEGSRVDTPAGWVLVPWEPKPEMLAAFWRIKNRGTLDIEATGEDRSDCAAYRAMLSAAPTPDATSGGEAPGSVLDKWQPIATAPKDGRYILVTNGTHVDLTRYSHGSFGGFVRDGDALRWQPLPAPPAAPRSSQERGDPRS